MIGNLYMESQKTPLFAVGMNETTVGHTGSNACGEDKVHFSSVKKKKVVFAEAGKRITPVVS